MQAAACVIHGQFFSYTCKWSFCNFKLYIVNLTYICLFCQREWRRNWKTIIETFPWWVTSAGVPITLVLSGLWRCNRWLWPLKRVWRGAPAPEKLEFWKLRNAIPSILGIKKSAVLAACTGKSFSGHSCCYNCFFIYLIPFCKFPRKSTELWLGWNLIRLIVLDCTLSVCKYCH